MKNIIEMGSHAVNSSCLPLLLKINYYANYAMYISIIFFIVNKCGHRTPGLNRLMGHQTISSWFIYRPFLLTFLSSNCWRSNSELILMVSLLVCFGSITTYTIGLSPQHYCGCLMSGPVFSLSYIVIFLCSMTWCKNALQPRLLHVNKV
jgi:hypothetical protein